VAVLISLTATWVAFRYHLVFNLDLTLISVAVVFPLVFTLGSAFQRRERALEHLGRAKGALSAIKYCFSYAKEVDESALNKVYDAIGSVKTELIAFLRTPSREKDHLNATIGEIQNFIVAHRKALGRSLSLRVYRLMRDVIMGVENAIAIKTHRTPVSIRAYCELFIYAFPFFYAPTLIKNIAFPEMAAGDIVAEGALNFIEHRFILIVYILNMLISFFLITLYNIQEAIENPFDQDGIDDIILDNYLIDY
jgi:hypothetical protein